MSVVKMLFLLKKEKEINRKLFFFPLGLSQHSKIMDRKLADRLVAQILLSHQRDDELLFSSRALAQHAAEKQTVCDKIDAVSQQIQTLDSTRMMLFKKHTAVKEQYAKNLRDDEEKRTQLSAELQERIDAVNAFSEATTTRHAKLLHENASLKEQCALLEQHRNSGDEKFQDLSAAREKELENLRKRLEQETERKPLLQEAVEKATALREEIRVEHDTWEKKASSFVEKFNVLQQKLTDAKKVFDAASGESESMAHRLNALDSDRQQALHRAEKAMRDRDVEAVKTLEIEKQVTTLEKQIEKLTGLLALLTGEKQQPTAAAHVDPATTA